MRPRTQPRRRRLLASRWAKLLPWLGFRYNDKRSSVTRDAYVLRGVGERFGPVLLVDRGRVAEREDAAEHGSSKTTVQQGSVKTGEDRARSGVGYRAQ
jgi:hypothetical protein